MFVYLKALRFDSWKNIDLNRFLPSTNLASSRLMLSNLISNSF